MDRKVHFPSSFWLLLTAWLVIVGEVILQTYLIVFQKDLFNAIYFVFSVPALLFGSLDLMKSRIVTTREGIEYHNPGFSINTSWDNIAQIESAVYLGKTQRVLTLIKPEFVKHPLFKLITFYSPISQLESGSQFIPIGQAIPLSLFDKNWEKNELGIEIRRNLPHLVAQ